MSRFRLPQAQRSQRYIYIDQCLFVSAAEFVDSAGRPLFTLKKKHMSMRMSFEGFTPAGDLLFEVGGKFERPCSPLSPPDLHRLTTSRAFAKSSARAWSRASRTSATASPSRSRSPGNWRHKKAEMVVVGTGQVVANLSCHMANAREIFAGQQTYHVEVGLMAGSSEHDRRDELG